MTIFFHKGLTRNLVIRNTPVWVLPNIWGLRGKLWIPNLARMLLIESYWMLRNSRVTGFTVLELLRENQLGSKITPPPQIRVKKDTFTSDWRKIQVNSSRKYAKFFSGEYYFPSYISPLNFIKIFHGNEAFT